MTPKPRRQRGGGSVYQRASDGLWVTRVVVPTPKGEPSKRGKSTLTGDEWLAFTGRKSWDDVEEMA